MKTIVISDTHLYHVFDEKKFVLLKNLFSSADNVILNGDFWDGYRTSFDLFINSPWKHLFPLLLKKNAVYLYGNHDQKKYSDARVSMFSVLQKNTHLLTTGKQTYHFEHGHLLGNSINIEYSLSRKMLHYITNVAQRLEYGLNMIGSPHNSIIKRGNKIIKKKLYIMRFPYWYICGHTHYGEVDKENKFSNSGFVQFGKASYLIIDSSGISFRTGRY